MIISKVIREHGFTIEQVAEKIGLKRGSLANMIGGNPTVDTLQKIADAIGCSRSEFFADETAAPADADIPDEISITWKKGKTVKYKKAKEDLTKGQTPCEATNPSQ